MIDYARLLRDLHQEYTARFPRSAEIQKQAEMNLIDGGSHALRLIKPFPPRIRGAGGAYVFDEDGGRILDFWQGHHANILGHNPPAITLPLGQALKDGYGLQTGFTDNLQAEVADMLCRATGSDKIRFTTSGSLATMYTVLLARAYTGRNLVMKIGGGWHGAQPWGLKGVDFHYDDDLFQHVDSAGLSPELGAEVIVTPFNDTSRLEDNIKKYGSRLACFIMEPFIGAGGFFPATGEFIRTARKLTEESGSLLIFDEIIAGFRFCPGSASSLYGVQPDLAAFGKIIGGGMPLAAVLGKEEVMRLCSSSAPKPVRFSGGTFSAHPAALLASKLMLTYLQENSQDIYPSIGALGEKLRRKAEDVCAAEGLYSCCTGYGNEVVTDSSLSLLFFPHEEGRRITSPAETRDPAVVDTELGGRILQLGLLLEDVHVSHGLGSLSTAHTEDDIDLFCEKLSRFVRRVRKYR